MTLRKPKHPDDRPAYLAIAADLRARIEHGELAAHAVVPSERELSEAHGVSRMTARHAVRLLEQEGYVYRRPARGTFVAEPRIPLRIGSFTDEVARAGREPGAELVWATTEEPAAAVREELGLAAGERVHGLQRLRRASGEPVALETTYIPAALCEDLLDGPLDGSLWRILRERGGIVPVRAEAVVEAVAIEREAAALLGVRPRSCGLLLRRRTFDAEDRCFEVARDLYRADRAAFHLDAPIADPSEPPGRRGMAGVRPGP